ncbi:unnamed protein product [Strongylus vulgaris]|uniref:SCP domain-containing protein n=1 Tax=Strongylus vulgaris TaxID=40348 RepID=A0A3P7KKB5_STRVU|nr:unnamed protein product [Strongylus vulgaris]
MCPKNRGMTDKVRRKFLNLHNQYSDKALCYRSSLARGLERDGLGGYAPKASRMLKMIKKCVELQVYDCSVEASALRYARKCVYAHSKRSERRGLGENLYMTSAINYNKLKAANQSSWLWWKELQDYGVGPSNVLTSALFKRPGKKIGHYSQMAWGTSYKLGCAVVACPKFTYGVCHYGPAGNWLGSRIYTMGDPCTQCPKSYTCNVAEGLCEKKSKKKWRRSRRKRDMIL